MDSKSVHRVAESMQQKARFDTKLKLWEVGPLRFTVGEVNKMHSGQLREQLFAKLRPGETLKQTAKQFLAENGGEETTGESPTVEIVEVAPEIAQALEAAIGHAPVAVETAAPSEVDQAAALLQKAGGSVTAALKEHAAQVAAGDKPMKPKQAKQRKEKKAKANGSAEKTSRVKLSPGNTFKISRKVALKPKDVVEGKLWLKQCGVHKWQLRQKAKAHGAPKEVIEVLKENTQWYGIGDMRAIVKHAIFTSQDKEVLAKKDEFTPYAVKCATEARDIAEKVLSMLEKL